MARTDKDRPWWVVQHQERFPIDHDHRNGACIVETIKDARPHRRWQHHKRCRKYITVEWSCTKAEPIRLSWYRSSITRSDFRGQTCWTSVCGCDPYDPGWHINCNRVRVGCIGHTRRERDASIPCVCDDFPPVATCTPSYRYDYRHTRGTPPADFRRSIYHGPERRRERDDLLEMAKDYNSNWTLEDDGDFFNRQGRNSARWDWW